MKTCKVFCVSLLYIVTLFITIVSTEKTSWSEFRCTKCQVVGKSDWKMCPKCGANLLNMDKLMFESAQHPDQALCRECHLMEDSLEKRHIESIGRKFPPKSDCLECHQGHNECAGCHQ